MAHELDVLPVALDPEALFFVMGLEGCTRAVLRSDRYEALAIGRTLRLEAGRFLDREKPERFVPRRAPVGRLRAFMALPLSDVAPELQEIVGRCQLYLNTLAPPGLTDGFLPVEYVPHSLELTTMRRAYAVLERPSSLFGLLGIGGLLPDEVASLNEAVPEVYQAFISAVVQAAIERRARAPQWQPTRMAKYQLPTLVGESNITVPQVADVFAAANARKQAARQPAQPDGGAVGALSDATPVQRRANGLPSPKDVVQR